MTTLLTRAPDRTATVPEESTRAPSTASPPVPAVTPAPRASEPRLALTGSLTRSASTDLEARLDRLAASEAHTVEVDLSRVERLDVDTARLLLRASWRRGDPGRRLLLMHPRPHVRRVLRFVGAGHLVVR